MSGNKWIKHNKWMIFSKWDSDNISGSYCEDSKQNEYNS